MLCKSFAQVHSAHFQLTMSAQCSRFYAMNAQCSRFYALHPHRRINAMMEYNVVPTCWLPQQKQCGGAMVE
jgi:hypothetical protein